jgi:heptosyltransferase-2
LRIGVFCPNWVGDAIMALPFFNACKETNPESIIIAICKSWVAPIFENHPAIDGIISFEKKDLTGFRCTDNAGRSLQALDLDKFYLLSDSYRAAFLAKKSKTAIRIGYPGQGRSMLLTQVIPKLNTKIHRSLEYIKLLGQSNVESLTGEQGISLNDKELDWAKNELIELGILNPIAFFPFSVASSRSLPELKVLDMLDKTSESILIMGGKGDKYKSEILVKASNKKNIHTVAGHYDLRKSIALISVCKGAVGVDSGLGHISANLGIPTVSLFGAGDTDSTGPIGLKIDFINKNVHCSPCLKNICQNRDQPLLCLEKINSKLPWTVLSKLSE